MNLKERAVALKRDIPAVFLALKAKETPLPAKILIILPVLVLFTCKLIPKDIFATYQKQAESMWQDGNPEKWYYALPIVLIWALILC